MSFYKKIGVYRVIKIAGPKVVGNRDEEGA